MAKKKNENPSLPADIVYIIMRNGKGAVMAYTRERFERFKANLIASGYREAKMEEIQKYYHIEEIQTIAPTEDKEEVTDRQYDHDTSE